MIVLDTLQAKSPMLNARFWTAARAVQHEPYLAQIEKNIVGAVYYPLDAQGDCHRYMVAQVKRTMGTGMLKCQFGARVTKLEITEDQRGSRVTGVHVEGQSGSKEVLQGDVVVIAAGAKTQSIMKLAGGSAPIYPVRGYSFSLPVRGHGPGEVVQSQVVDYDHRVYSTRIGDKVRFVTGAEISGYNKKEPNKTVVNALRELSHELSPSFVGKRLQPVVEKDITFWRGERPVSADGLPIISWSPVVGNVAICAGHGTAGWKLSAISGLMLTRLVMGDGKELKAAVGNDSELLRHIQDIDLNRFSLERFTLTGWLKERFHVTN